MLFQGGHWLAILTRAAAAAGLQGPCFRPEQPLQALLLHRLVLINQLFLPPASHCWWLFCQTIRWTAALRIWVLWGGRRPFGGRSQPTWSKSTRRRRGVAPGGRWTLQWASPFWLLTPGSGGVTAQRCPHGHLWLSHSYPVSPWLCSSRVLGRLERQECHCLHVLTSVTGTALVTLQIQILEVHVDALPLLTHCGIFESSSWLIHSIYSFPFNNPSYDLWWVLSGERWGCLTPVTFIPGSAMFVLRGVFL